MDISSQITSLVNDHADKLGAEVSNLFKSTVLNGASQANGAAKPAAAAVAPTAPAAPKHVATPAAKTAKKTAAKKTAPAAASNGQKRDPEVLSKLVETLAGYISSHPGEGIEQIAKGLGISSKELGVPKQKLLAAGRITFTGEKRTTKYFPRA